MKNFYFLTGLWAALFSANAQQVATFDDVELETGSYYNGSDGAGGFTSGGFWFPNDYNADWASWSGFSVSNMKDSTTAGWQNQYSAITAGGANSSENYAVVYFPGELKVKFDEPAEMIGFYVTNATYSYHAMRDGDDYAKKFGGADGTDPDYFKLLIWGTNETGLPTDSVEFFLADFRFENPDEDYIVNEWKWLELSSLGEVKELNFGMESTDVGNWGMNTPAYFCMDNFTATQLTSSGGSVSVNRTEIVVYPNPVINDFFVEIPESAKKIIVTDGTGRILFGQKVSEKNKVKISALKGLVSGVYFLKVETDSEIITRKIIKKGS